MGIGDTYILKIIIGIVISVSIELYFKDMYEQDPG